MFMENDLDNVQIPVYVINLKERTERYEHIKQQFLGKDEFVVEIIQSEKNVRGNVGLWENIVHIVRTAQNKEEDIIILCEDDHIFTQDYNKKNFIQSILNSYEQNVQVISGGTSGGFSFVIPVDKNRYWVNHFWGLQFTVIFSSFFNDILNYIFLIDDTADDVISSLTVNKMVIYPFISIQKDFGYSDVTLKNHINENWVDKLFQKSQETLEIYKKIADEFIWKK